MRLPEAIRRGLELLAFSSFAVAQPLLDLLARFAGFFVARRAAPSEIVAIALGLLLLPPLLLWVIEFAIGRVSSGAERVLHRVLLALLIALTVLPPLHRSELVPALPAVAIGAIAGIAGALLLARFALLRSFALTLSLAPALFVFVFFSNPWVGSLVFRDDPLEFDAPSIELPAPVVLVIFDELPLSSLMDSRGEIDAIRYPAFARLARGSTWLRNASSVDGRTLQVIPSLLTGRYPGTHRRLPTTFEYPKNLISLMAANAPMHVVETQTMLYETNGEELAPSRARSISVGSDLGYVYLHMILPPAWRSGLPAVDRTWKHFHGEGPILARGQQSLRYRRARFLRFIEKIEPSEKPGFHFLHIMLPHGPWHYLPSGNIYSNDQSIGFLFGTWSENPWWSLDGYRRHLLQLELTDALLGELMDHMKSIGSYDESLLLVTADHGIAFWPGEASRILNQTSHPEDILSVPLFIKAPGQSGAERIDRNVETVDILPSLLGLLDIELPWEIDGCSVFDSACPERLEKIGFTPDQKERARNQQLTFPRDIVSSRASLDRKIAMFGDGSTPSGLYRFGPYARLVGRKVDDLLNSTRHAGILEIEHAPASRKHDTGATPGSYARILGRLRLIDEFPDEADELQVAIAVDGIVRTVVPAANEGFAGLRSLGTLPSNDTRWVSALIPEEYAGDPTGPDIRAFLVVPTPSGTTLRPLNVH